jgi:lysophospholipase L1-like esterase
VRQSTTTPKSRALKWGRRLFIAIVIVVILGELTGRYFGLGNPPLLVTDPQIEYYNKPSSSYHRFGNQIRYNAYGMRSDDFPEAKASSDELRVLVLGDSVVNGGARTDQSQLATTLLKAQLREELGRPVVVGNISAGSWGPANLLAYVNRFGLFEADFVVIVLSSHDYADTPTFGPIDSPTVDRSPVFALEELATTYLPRYLPRKRSSHTVEKLETPQIIGQVQQALRELIDKARSQGAQVILAQHLEKSEAKGALLPGHQVIKQTAEDMDVPVVQLGPVFIEAINAGNDPYRDWIHPNAYGQELIAQTLYTKIKRQLEEEH